MPIDLATVTQAPVGIFLSAGDYGFLRVQADPGFDVDEFGMALLADLAGWRDR